MDIADTMADSHGVRNHRVPLIQSSENQLCLSRAVPIRAGIDAGEALSFMPYKKGDPRRKISIAKYNALKRSRVPIPIKYLPEDILSKFWERVDKNGPIPSHLPELGPCWQWTGQIMNQKGKEYGWFSMPHKNVRAHRVSYEINGSEIQKGMHVLHHCDNPSCVRPDHLWVGTHQQNMEDMKRKHRAGPAVHPHTMKRGIEHHNAKLTEELVLEIRAFKTPKYSDFRNFGRKISISAETVRSAFLRKTWVHVGKTAVDIS